jgi:hypothetical protein
MRKPSAPKHAANRGKTTPKQRARNKLAYNRRNIKSEIKETPNGFMAKVEGRNNRWSSSQIVPDRHSAERIVGVYMREGNTGKAFTESSRIQQEAFAKAREVKK